MRSSFSKTSPDYFVTFLNVSGHHLLHLKAASVGSIHGITSFVTKSCIYSSHLDNSMKDFFNRS